VVTFAPIDDLERLKRLQRVSDAALSLLSVEDLVDELLLRVRDTSVPIQWRFCSWILKGTSSLPAQRRDRGGMERGVRIPVGIIDSSRLHGVSVLAELLESADSNCSCPRHRMGASRGRLSSSGYTRYPSTPTEAWRSRQRGRTARSRPYPPEA
jgi:hypothetical protein